MYKNTLKINLPKILIFFCLFLIIGVFTLPKDTKAVGVSENISLEMSPQNPGAFETVSFKLISYSVDLDRAKISWFINGKKNISGIGKTNFSFNSGGIGSVSKITVSIQSKSSIVDRSITVIPTGVDILWEAVGSYTPPFYKGKALASSQSLIKMTAIPNIPNNKDASSMIYRWKKNYKFRDFNNQSGYGKQSVVFRRDLLRNSEVIEVIVTSFNNNVSASNKFTLDKYSPKIVFYKKHPLEGILYNNAIGDNLNIDEKEAIVVAEPYFFSTKNKDISLLSYVWSLNNKKVDDLESDSKNEIVLRRGESSGTSKISLNIRNTKNILQYAGKIFNISF
jgi:hypothetical protein